MGHTPPQVAIRRSWKELSQADIMAATHTNSLSMVMGAHNLPVLKGKKPPHWGVPNKDMPSKRMREGEKGEDSMLWKCWERKEHQIRSEQCMWQCPVRALCSTTDVHKCQWLKELLDRVKEHKKHKHDTRPAKPRRMPVSASRGDTFDG